MIHHKLPDCIVQQSAITLEKVAAKSCYLSAPLKICNVEVLHQVNMAFGRKRKLWFSPHDRTSLLSASDSPSGTDEVGDVRHLHHEELPLVHHLLKLLFL
jgi:hypothetical protein